MPDDSDLLPGTGNLHPTPIDLSYALAVIGNRPFTPEEKAAILQAAHSANSTHEWIAAVGAILGTLAKAAL